MKTKTPAFQATDDDIRAYAEHLYEQSGCVPGRDLDNWLEAEASLRFAAEVICALAQRRQEPPHGFTMPPSDTALWIEKAGCTGMGNGQKAPRRGGDRRGRSRRKVEPGITLDADLPAEP